MKKRQFYTTLPLVLLSLGLALKVFGQDPDKLYFMHYGGVGQYSFSSLDLADASVTNFELIQVAGISGVSSSCVDPLSGTYSLCTGTELYLFDADGVTPPQVITLPLVTPQQFMAIEYDPCLQRYVGILRYSFDSLVFSSFQPGTGEFTGIVAMDPTMAFPMGGQAMFDPDQRLYMLLTSAGFLGIDVDAGTMVYDTAIEDLAGYTPLNHLAYDCSNGRIFGTMVGACPEGGTGKYLAQLDPTTGDVEIITEHCIGSGVMKPALGGSAIDTATAVFYWSGAGGVVVGADENPGALVYDETISNGELFLIEHFSVCACTDATGVQTVVPASESLTVHTAQGAILINGLLPNKDIVIVDACGRVMTTSRSTDPSVSISTSQFAPGTYFLTNDGRTSRFVLTH